MGDGYHRLKKEEETVFQNPERSVMWYHVTGQFDAYVVDDLGDLVPVKNPRLVRAFFNAAFWQYVR